MKSICLVYQKLRHKLVQQLAFVFLSILMHKRKKKCNKLPKYSQRTLPSYKCCLGKPLFSSAKITIRLRSTFCSLAFQLKKRRLQRDVEWRAQHSRLRCSAAAPSKMTSMAFVMVNNLPEWPNKCQSLAQAHRRANF